MVQYFGMSDEVGPVFYHPQDASISAHERQVVDAEVKRLLSAAHERARKLLTEKREELRLVRIPLQHSVSSPAYACHNPTARRSAY